MPIPSVRSLAGLTLLGLALCPSAILRGETDAPAPPADAAEAPVGLECALALPIGFTRIDATDSASQATATFASGANVGLAGSISARWKQWRGFAEGALSSIKLSAPAGSRFDDEGYTAVTFKGGAGYTPWESLPLEVSLFFGMERHVFVLSRTLGVLTLDPAALPLVGIGVGYRLLERGDWTARATVSGELYFAGSGQWIAVNGGATSAGLGARVERRLGELRLQGGIDLGRAGFQSAAAGQTETTLNACLGLAWNF